MKNKFKKKITLIAGIGMDNPQAIGGELIKNRILLTF